MSESPLTSKHVVVIPPDVDMVRVLGPGDEYLGIIEGAFTCDVHVRGNRITLRGDYREVDVADQLIAQIVELVRRGQVLSNETIEKSIELLRAKQDRPVDVLGMNILSNRGRTIRPKTLNQKKYVDAIDENTITFGIGPAGTGKTYLAMAKAVQALNAKQVSRIILTRPAVEAGERLGYLPGTLTEKIDPYLRPLYDALHEMVDPIAITKMMETGVVEVAPLAYMRGRTLNDAFIILDEAQNTSPEQMKMFLTRLGFGSKIVVTGDVTQIDLPGGVRSGLKVIEEILDGVKDISFHHLTSHDVVRHSLVGKIVLAYDRFDAAKEAERLRVAEHRASQASASQAGAAAHTKPSTSRPAKER